MLSPEELKRYNRHLILPEFGLEAQEKLKSSKVLVVGAGGLGCPVLLYLAAAGAGTIGIIDFDKVDESNLQRQVLFTTEDIGKNKAEAAAERLSKLNPHSKFIVHNSKLSKDNTLEIMRGYDIVIDGSDNFPTRYLVNDSCVILNKPLVFGSIFKFEGQVTVFNYTDAKGKRGPTYRCLFPEPPAPGEVPNCSETGVLGVLPGLIGTMQANEAIKVITGIGEVLSGKLLVMDALTMSTLVLKFSAVDKNYKITSLGEYEEVCEIPSGKKSITVSELKTKLESGENIFLLDVREQYESEICSLGGELIPLKNIPGNFHKIPKDIPVVVYCHHGTRSAAAIQFLEEKGYNNLMNLEGGIHAWAVEIDEEMGRY
jgi:adenylyltransferase/sulfurtransferase